MVDERFRIALIVTIVTSIIAICIRRNGLIEHLSQLTFLNITSN